MSYDLEVYAARRPAVPDGVEVDGPFEAQDEDAPPEVVAALLTVRWLVQLAGKESLAAAKAIAESGRGVVYDPQKGAIVWPRNPAKLRAVETDDKREHGKQIRLNWLFARHLTAADAHRFLAVLRDALPEAVPVRFGDYEPMQGRLERDGDDAFAAYWDGDHSLFWSGRRPVADGFVWLHRGMGAALPPAEREALLPMIHGRRAIQPDEITLDFQVAGDPEWLDALATLLARVGRELNAFFAAGHREDRKVDIVGRYWLGLPPAPLWLAWIGEVYGGPALTRTSVRPDKPRRIAWPAEYVRNGDEPAAVIPDLSAA